MQDLNGDARLVRLTWEGSLCDGRVVVTIDPAGTSIVVDSGPRPACDASAMGRELILTFRTRVDPTKVRVDYLETITRE